MDITSLDIRPPRKQRMNIRYLDAKLDAAFQSDCDQLLQKFRKLQTYSFMSFAQVWKEQNFLAIFKGLDNILTLKAFIENALFTTKKFLYSSDVCIQIGALYVLYGLYYKQPIKKLVKVRLTQADVDKLNEIIDKHKSLDSLEPVFIYSKMKLDRAFHYCALPRPLGLESKFLRRTDFSPEEATSSHSSVLSKFKSLMEDEPDLVQFEEIDDEYQKLAQKYKDQLFIFPSQLGADLKKAYSETFDVKLDEEVKEEVKHIEETKTKAMASANATYRGERKVLTAFDLKTPSTSFNS